MVSIGTEAYVTRLIADEIQVTSQLRASHVTKLIADEIQVTSQLRASHKVIGPDEKNLVQLHQNGSIFYLKYPVTHQISKMETSDQTSEVTFTTNAAHNLSNGDTVHISDSFEDAIINGVPTSELIGTHQVASVEDTTFKIATVSPGDNDGDIPVSPLVRIDRYKYIDMADPTATSWSNSTTIPSPSHTNNEIFFL